MKTENGQHPIQGEQRHVHHNIRRPTGTVLPERTTENLPHMYHQGHCTMAQPGIPEQVIQHLNHIRLENLLAPRWSIILNEHGCQLQVYWRAPSSVDKDQVQCKAESDLPPAKKARKQEINQFRPTNGTPPVRPVGMVTNGQISRRNIVANIRQPQSMHPCSLPTTVSPVGLYRPPYQSTPTSPKFSKQPAHVTPPKISLQALVNHVQRDIHHEQLSPKNFQVQQAPPRTPPPPPPPQQSQQQVKVAEVSIPIKRNTMPREPRKSIEATALMLMADRESFNATEKIISSPPEFITPPGSERSLSGEGKDTITSETSEQTQKTLEYAMSDAYRQKFSCEICHKTFTRKYSLSRHYKEVHQGESRSSKFQSLGPSLLAINERSVSDARLLNDFGVPTLTRVQFPAAHTSDNDVKIEDLSHEEDDISPSMVLNRSNQST